MKNMYKLVVPLALGALITFSGIPACKKPSQGNTLSTTQHEAPISLNSVSQPGHAPVPSTILLLGSGMAGMGLLAWRKRKKR
jgi:hypothetical protein